MIGVVSYVIAALMGLTRALFLDALIPKSIIEAILWYSPIPIFLGISIFIVGLGKISRVRLEKDLTSIPHNSAGITVALTAYNDEQSIGDSVKDFLRLPIISRVIVISNNSSDNTFRVAKDAGAIVYNEEQQGYGSCVYRAMSEACRSDDSGVVVICEGDMTFRANDLHKMLPYLEHVDVVNGTRIVEALQSNSTQLSMFMHYGNLFVAKLLEVKYFGRVSLSDVGTTYKVVRTSSLKQLLPLLDPTVNLAFNPHFLERVLQADMKLVEVPITFHPRVGLSKGGNTSNRVALNLGLKMILGIVGSWKWAK